MLTILGWIVAIIVLLIVVVIALFIWLAPSYYLSNVRTPHVSVNVHSGYDTYGEGMKRLDRSAQLSNLRTDLRQAEELMELEEGAQQLQRRYAQRGQHGSQYSPEVEETLRRIFEKIERVKRGGAS